MHDSLRIGYTILLVDRSLRFEFKTVSCSDYTPPGRCRRYLHLADSLNLWTLMYTLLMSHMKRTDPRLQFEPAANSCLKTIVEMWQLMIALVLFTPLQQLLSVGDNRASFIPWNNGCRDNICSVFGGNCASPIPRTINYIFTGKAKGYTSFQSCVYKRELPAKACQRHVDCPGRRSLCFATQCIRARPLPAMGSCRSDINCRTNSGDLRQQGRGCKFAKCYEIMSIPGSRSCNFQEECKGQSVCIQYHCVPGEPTERRCYSQAQCGVGERCISGMCFRPISKLRRHPHYPHEYNEPMGYDTVSMERYGPPYPPYDIIDEYSVDDDFLPTSYVPPPVPECVGVTVCPAMCCSINCPQAACCCQATYFNYY
ncbi:hypothetical protein M513_06050 [Trichuris suis]|uniref:DUF7107 domain-containing protein n=1 Tax=Trichuris suis TaxID=68888 RepID=A0A085M7E0_9BILA|nr:hypothetical protein M513_06050 [Trichuris suis]